MRVDAERNRLAILAAAGRLICEGRLDHVSMDDIAAEAGVGKGTLFRRFSDREGLIRALIEEKSCRWWEGASERARDTTVPPRDRALAFVDEVFTLVAVEIRPLMRAQADNCGGAQFQQWLKLLAGLIAEVRPEADAEFLAYAIFSSMRPEIAEFVPGERLRVGVRALTASVLGD